MELLVITGLSGSGKTSVIQVLSEERYVILESLSAKSLPNVIDEINANQPNDRVAIVIRYNNEKEFNDKVEAIRQLEKRYSVTRLFLKANRQVLMNRYRELRKSHPLMLVNKNLLLEESLVLETKITQEFKKEADYIIDTSDLAVKDLKASVLSVIKKQYEFNLNIVSFGFKHGSVHEADYVFDVRFLPNPYYIEELRPKTGLDDAVYNYVFSFEIANEYYEHVLALLKIAIDGFKKEKRLQATIAFACTGGKHRSVSFARRLAKELDTQNNNVVVRHIEGERGNW